ncbi:outer membrane protein assembly factor BamB family protein [Halostella litorea]|uniref:outer membrane protein assembly factor BamB family protein n=1 Tax=Halostella litorea TaxID=2528831 RepID=UPI001091D7C4|nr:PQQ-binding-like beta-propeller repeat protein [Halostella litorea]
MTGRVGRRTLLKTAGAGTVAGLLGSASAVGGGDRPAQEDAQEISSVEGLRAIEDDLAGDYVLAADIDASGVDFRPLGSADEPFVGSLVGDGHVITGLTIDGRGTQGVGLFSVVGSRTGGSGGTAAAAGGYVADLSLDGATVRGAARVGALAGVNRGSVTGVSASGTVEGRELTGGLLGENGGCVERSESSCTVTGDGRLGGLVGKDAGYVSECSASGSVTGGFTVGGLVGLANSRVHRSTATGPVTGEGRPSTGLGGLVGVLGGEASYCAAEGAVTGSGSAENVGGLVGYASGVVLGSRASGAVNGAEHVGGLVGNCRGEVTESTAENDVTGYESVGGVVGQLNTGAEATRASSSGAVAGTSGFGGVAGRNDGTIGQCGASGRVVGESPDGDPTVSGGGVAGENYGTVAASYATAAVEADIIAGGVVGSNYRAVTESFAAGPVTAKERDGGGIVGTNDDDDEDAVPRNSYWDHDATGQAAAVGDGSGRNLVGLSTGAMQGSAAPGNMPELDFETQWGTRSGDYPEPIDRPRKRWRFQTLDRVWAAPTVVDGTVYVGTKPDLAGCEPNLYAVDAASGEAEWTFDTESGGTRTTGRDRRDAYVGGSAANVVDGTVYLTLPITGTAIAVDADEGRESWRTDLDMNAWDSMSPTRYGDVLFTKDRSTLYWLDAATGDELMRRNVDWTGVAITAADGLVYGVDRTDGLLAYEVASGERRWSYGVEGSPDSAPTVADGTLYIGGDDGVVHAVDAVSGAPEWTFEATVDGGADPVNSTPTVAGGTVYVKTQSNTLYALDAATGDRQWSHQGDPTTVVESSPTVAGGTVFVGLGGGRLVALDAGSGEAAWTFAVRGGVASSPTVVDGVVYVGSTAGFLYALDAGVDGSSVDSRVELGTTGHHGAWSQRAATATTEAPDGPAGTTTAGTTTETTADTTPADGTTGGGTTADGTGGTDGGGSTVTDDAASPDSSSDPSTAGSDGAEDEESSVDSGTPGMGVGSALAGIGSLGYLLKRRLDDEDG